MPTTPAGQNAQHAIRNLVVVTSENEKREKTNKKRLENTLNLHSLVPELAFLAAGRAAASARDQHLVLRFSLPAAFQTAPRMRRVGFLLADGQLLRFGRVVRLARRRRRGDEQRLQLQVLGHDSLVDQGLQLLGVRRDDGAAAGAERRSRRRFRSPVLELRFALVQLLEQSAELARDFFVLFVVFVETCGVFQSLQGDINKI